MNKIISDAIQNARDLVGTKEAGNNRGILIDKIEKEFGLVGQAYCVMFILYCYIQAAKKYSETLLLPKTASSQTLFEYAQKQNLTYQDPTLLKPGDIAIYRKFKLWQGHAAFVVSNYSPEEKTFQTIEGNTSNSNFGSQSDGDGIYNRVRACKKINFEIGSFYLRGFIDMGKVYKNN
jgi:hypothetical protein